MIISKPCVLVMATAVLLASCSKKAPEIPVPGPTATPVEAPAPQALVLPPGTDPTA